MIPFHYTDSMNEKKTGEIRLLSDNDPMEMDIEANSLVFHVLVGEHRYGRYICIPNWNIGTEYSRLCDEFWNGERLRNNTELHPDNITAVVRAVSTADEWIRRYHREECG